MSFETLKKSSGKFDKLQNELEKLNSPAQTSSFQDDRFWKPELDKSGNGYAVFRFLPQPDGEELPWVRLWNHAFKGPGGWYIENSLTTINKKDPVSEYNTELWNSGNESDKDIARKQKRVLKYYANIYVVSDTKHPENEGKIMLFRFGKKIFDKITEAMKPEFEDEKPINPFDFWEGANFKLKIRKVDGYWNYDKSEFDSPSAIKDNDDSIQQIWDKQFALKPFLAPENFKSYDELKAKVDKVLSGSRSTGTAENVAIPPVTNVAPVQTETVDKTLKTPGVDEDGDETLSYFTKLAEEDA